MQILSTLRLAVACSVQALFDLLLPQKCLSCQKVGEILCENCLYRLPKESSPYGIMTILAYSDPVVREAIRLLKYKGIKGVAQPFAKIVYERLLEELSSITELSLLSKEKIIIIPAPLSKEREKERGFNQAALIAREIGELDQGRSFDIRTDILEKIKNTPSQVAIKNRTERIKNLRGAFKLKRGRGKNIKDKIVVLLDDVTTTGTTLNECAKVLRCAKPRQIIKVAVAH